MTKKLSIVCTALVDDTTEIYSYTIDATEPSAVVVQYERTGYAPTSGCFAVTNRSADDTRETCVAAGTTGAAIAMLVASFAKAHAKMERA